MNIYVREKREEEQLFHCRHVKIISKLVQKVIEKFCVLQQRKIEQGIEIIVPDIKNKRVIDKIVQKIEKNGNAKIILSKKIKKLQKNWEKINLVTGKKMQKYFLPKILEKISGKAQDIYLLMDLYTAENIQIIEFFMEKCRSVTIVTKEIKKYSELAEKIQEEKGLIIPVLNNRKKSLKKAKIIANIDFLEERIKEFKIDRNAIILNCMDTKIVDISGFEGIIINKVEIERKDNLFEEYEAIEIYESLYEFKEKFILNIGKLEKENIKYFIGNNGQIEKKEIANMMKIA